MSAPAVVSNNPLSQTIPPKNVTVAATQFSCTWDRMANVAKAEKFVRLAHAKGAQIILLQELFEAPYFCKDQKVEFFDLAQSVDSHPMLQKMQVLARELGVVLPVSFFEKSNNAHFNSVVVFDSDGTNLGLYRKSHIPDGPGYQEKCVFEVPTIDPGTLVSLGRNFAAETRKFLIALLSCRYYFSPGDTGFKVFSTKYAKIGVGICWDQWFPEAARCMALQGAEILFYPTAIGSEPQDSLLDSRDHWQRVMQGHAGANLVPLVASNRVGVEKGEEFETTFYGSSFITGPTGEKVAEANRTEETVLVATFDLAKVARQRTGWGVFRDRRPELYGAINSY